MRGGRTGHREKNLAGTGDDSFSLHLNVAEMGRSMLRPYKCAHGGGDY